MTPDEEALFADLEDVFAEVDADEVDDFTTMPLPNLLERYSRAMNWVKDNGHVISADTQEARDMLSEYAAIKIILIDRGVI